MKRMFAVLVLVMLTLGCAHLDYVGKSYPPTQNVDVVFREQDLHHEYTVIGQLVATGDELVSASKLQQKIIERAKQAGADAVIIEGLDRIVTGSSTSYNETERNRHRRRSASGTAVTTDQESKRVHAEFVKYKHNE